MALKKSAKWDILFKDLVKNNDTFSEVENNIKYFLFLDEGSREEQWKNAYFEQQNPKEPFPADGVRENLFPELFFSTLICGTIWQGPDQTGRGLFLCHDGLSSPVLTLLHPLFSFCDSSSK